MSTIAKRRAFRSAIGAAAIAATIGVESRAGEEVLIRHCEIGYDRVTTVGAFVLVQAGGRVQDCYVKPGDRVKAGQVLGRLHDRDAVHELERLTKEAEANIDERLGIAKHEVALVKLRQAEILRHRSAISDDQLLLARLEVTTTELEIEAARHRRKGDNLLRRRMEAEVRSREFVCPHDGVVVEIVKNVGESCICNEAVMKIVHDDVLWVTGMVDVGDAWRVKSGQLVRVRPEVEGAELEIESRTFEGRVVFVDPGIDPLTRSTKVIAEVDNRDHQLRSGIQASLVIDLSTRPWEGTENPPDRPLASAPTGPARWRWPGGSPAPIAEIFLKSLRVPEVRTILPEGAASHPGTSGH